METKVSDFKFAEHFLRAVCRRFGVPFTDAPVAFRYQDDIPGCDNSATPDARVEDGEIVVVQSKSLGQTLLGIIGGYVNNLSKITGANASTSDPERVELIKTATAAVRAFLYSPDTLPEAWEQPYPAVSLSHFPFVWLLMRDVFCPLHQAELKDTRVILDRSPEHDAVVAGQATVEDETIPVLFVNLEIESDIYRTAFLLASALKVHGLDEKAVLSGIFNDGELRRRVEGLAKLAFVAKEKVQDFMTTLAVLTGKHELHNEIETNDSSQSPVWYKSAQNTTSRTQAYEGVSMWGAGGNWFMPMLTEALLGTARGTDASATERLEAVRKDLWNRVAEEKKRRGKDDMSLEDLLRVQSKGMRPDPQTILQGLLSAERVW